MKDTATPNNNNLFTLNRDSLSNKDYDFMVLEGQIRTDPKQLSNTNNNKYIKDNKDIKISEFNTDNDNNNRRKNFNVDI